MADSDSKPLSVRLAEAGVDEPDALAAAAKADAEAAKGDKWADLLGEVDPGEVLDMMQSIFGDASAEPTRSRQPARPPESARPAADGGQSQEARETPQGSPIRQKYGPDGEGGEQLDGNGENSDELAEAEDES